MGYYIHTALSFTHTVMSLAFSPVFVLVYMVMNLLVNEYLLVHIIYEYVGICASEYTRSVHLYKNQ